jgi:hypothetical protein
MLIFLLTLIFAPIAVGAIFSSFINPSSSEIPRPSTVRLKVGDRIVYNKTKSSSHPGNRAREVFPCITGDNYTYVVEKYWVVADVLEDGRLVAKTRTGKFHFLNPSDLNLRKAGLVEKMRHHDRFPELA